MANLKLNKRLLRKVRNRIAEIPESYDQEGFCLESADAPCGTAACLAGETVICAAPSIAEGVTRLKKMDNDYAVATRVGDFDSRIADEAATLLGLDDETAAQIFDVDGGYSDLPLTVRWPEPFARNFRKATTKDGRANVAVAYLDECLKRGKVIW